MGNTWTVWAWLPAQGPWGPDYAYQEVHAGESAMRALVAAWRAKRAGAGCVKVEWR